MTEPDRLESSLGAAHRDSQTEALLVDGLDRYFNGQYYEAINLWTRVLFIDRSHARARAYIDRARTALAERQRHVEELLHTANELVTRGDTIGITTNRSRYRSWSSTGRPPVSRPKTSTTSLEPPSGTSQRNRAALVEKK